MRGLPAPDGVLWLRRGDSDVERLGRGAGLSRAVAYRYRDEGIELLERQASDQHESLERAKAEDPAFLVLDGRDGG